MHHNFSFSEGLEQKYSLKNSLGEKKSDQIQATFSPAAAVYVWKPNWNKIYCRQDSSVRKDATRVCANVAALLPIVTETQLPILLWTSTEFIIGVHFLGQGSPINHVNGFLDILTPLLWIKMVFWPTPIAPQKTMWNFQIPSPPRDSNFFSKFSTFLTACMRHSMCNRSKFPNWHSCFFGTPTPPACPHGLWMTSQIISCQNNLY